MTSLPRTPSARPTISWCVTAIGDRDAGCVAWRAIEDAHAALDRGDVSSVDGLDVDVLVEDADNFGTLDDGLHWDVVRIVEDALVHIERDQLRAEPEQGGLDL